jgi:hypothetical protein
MACQLDSLNDSAGSSVVVMQKISSMISSNYTILMIMFVILGLLVFGLSYFGRSLLNTLTTYYQNRNAQQTTTSTGDSLKDKAADNEEYPEDDTQDAEEDIDGKIKVDPTKFMPKGKRDFLQNLELENKEYNEEKTKFLTRNMNYDTNDDVVDSQILYKDYDNYSYDYATVQNL